MWYASTIRICSTFLYPHTPDDAGPRVPSKLSYDTRATHGSHVDDSLKAVKAVTRKSRYYDHMSTSRHAGPRVPSKYDTRAKLGMDHLLMIR